MIRRFNYTSRKRIPRKDISIRVQSADARLWFDAQLSKLEAYGLPKDSLVHVEAYRQANWARFEFGMIGSIAPPANRDLSMFGTHEGLLFRVKVAEPKTGRLLAEADRVPFLLPEQNEAPRDPLLPIRPQDLGKQVCRLDFSDDRVGPVLLINSRAGRYQAIARNPAFFSLIYPGALREVLTRILYIEDHFDASDEDDWRSRWLRFAQSFPGAGPMPSSREETQQFDYWIDQVVSTFSGSVGVREKFADFWSEEA